MKTAALAVSHSTPQSHHTQPSTNANGTYRIVERPEFPASQRFTVEEFFEPDLGWSAIAAYPDWLTAEAALDRKTSKHEAVNRVPRSRKARQANISLEDAVAPDGTPLSETIVNPNPPESPLHALMETAPGFPVPLSAEELQAADGGVLEAVAEALATLPARQGQVLALHLEGQSTVEIGRGLGIAQQVAHRHLQTALTRVRSQLAYLIEEAA